MEPKKEIPIFNGTIQERKDIYSAIENNCDCTFDRGVRTDVCKPHALFTGPQEDLDKLLAGRRKALTLLEQEFQGSKIIDYINRDITANGLAEAKAFFPDNKLFPSQ